MNNKIDMSILNLLVGFIGINIKYFLNSQIKEGKNLYIMKIVLYI